MAENKTKENGASVEGFLASVENPKRRADAELVVEMMTRITGLSPKMWGTKIIGFDRYHYKYASGREGDALMIGLSPGKAALSIYIMPGFKKYAHLMEKLGKFKNTVSCLYITRLENVDLDVLEELIAVSVKDMRARYPKD
ncbi:MAG: DUF1801 domain-containing protein [Paracoccaceae bacterium]